MHARPEGRAGPVLACVILAAALVTGDGATARDRAIMGSGIASCGS